MFSRVLGVIALAVAVFLAAVLSAPTADTGAPSPSASLGATLCITVEGSTPPTGWDADSLQAALLSRTAFITSVRSSCVPTGSPVPSASHSPAPTIAPTSRPTPSRTPRPTPAPPSLRAGTLRYQPSSCWSSTWRDGQGHQTGGVPVRFVIPVTNRGGPSGPLWVFVHSDSIDASAPSTRRGSAGKLYRYDDQTTAIRFPKMAAKESRRLAFTVIFFTPFDPHYTLTLAEGSEKEAIAAYEGTTDSIGSWQAWTTANVC